MRARINSSKRKRGHCEIQERDYLLLRFLWKWKVVSSMALARKFFPDINPLSAYRRLQYLEADKYIKPVIFEGRGREAWTLGDRGFNFIFPKLGELKQKGYKSENVHHDFLTTAFHLGEWLSSQPDNSQAYSEQQLRRVPMDAWPSWVPKSTTHRPDGYSAFIINGKRTTITFEVELSVKERSRYESPVAFYDSEESIQFVFWLIDSKVTLNALNKSFEKFQMRSLDKHHFILLSDFEAKGWMAPFVQGKFSGLTPWEVIHRKGIAQPSQWHRGHDVLALLDLKRRPIISAPCSNAPDLKKAD